jgi:hypothetical protein
LSQVGAILQVVPVPAVTRQFSPEALSESPEVDSQKASSEKDKDEDAIRKAEKLKAMQARLAVWQRSQQNSQGA